MCGEDRPENQRGGTQRAVNYVSHGINFDLFND